MAQLLSNLPVGAKIKFGKYSVNGETAEPIRWLVVAKNHGSTPEYPAKSITLLTENIIDLLCFDAKEPNNSNTLRSYYGNNRYSLSNIDQWLNKDSAAGAWYSSQHSVDNAPNSASVVEKGASYATRPGFLNAFTAWEKNAIQNTTIRVTKSTTDGGGYEDISRKVFLPSRAEVGLGNENGVSEGNKWGYFDNSSVYAYLTAQAYNNTLSVNKPDKVSSPWIWGFRTPNTSQSQSCRCVGHDGTLSFISQCQGEIGVRPALNLLSTVSVSDTADSDGCYAIISNSAPSSPASLVTPSTIYGGKFNSISWSNSTDIDGDTITYQLECSINGGAYSQVYSGVATTYNHLVPLGTTSVTYRVKATDSQGESSAYTTSATKTVTNNNAPVISGADSNLGVKSSGFTGTYTVTDANSNAVTVTEAIDGVQIRSLVATLGAEITYGITGNTWLALSNGSHTLTIHATDGIDTTVRTYTFTKLVNSFTIRNSTPWVSTTEPATMPSRIMLVVTRNLPSEATFKVEVCNNGYDASPTWEDATDAVKSGLVHVFTNKTKTASNWGVLIKVTVERNGATGACYISAIGGNFE